MPKVLWVGGVELMSNLRRLASQSPALQATRRLDPTVILVEGSEESAGTDPKASLQTRTTEFEEKPLSVKTF